jgi:prepilin-type N-terminal cleavage/methylation domain-containing protein
VNNRGLTVIELIIAITVGSIILLAFTCQFVAEATFRKAINDQIAATNDASIVMRHMTRVLRYAKPSTINTSVVSGYTTSITATIDHAAAHPFINHDYWPEFTADTVVIYGRKSDNTFEYKKGSAAPVVISNRMKAFPVTFLWLVGSNLTIQLTAQQGNRSSSLKTKVHVLGI